MLWDGKDKTAGNGNHRLFEDCKEGPDALGSIPDL